MAPVGVLVRFEAKPDMVDEVEALLTALAGQVQREESTIAWFGFREGPTTFGVFHAFSDEAGRETHDRGQRGDQSQSIGTVRCRSDSRRRRHRFGEAALMTAAKPLPSG